MYFLSNFTHRKLLFYFITNSKKKGGAHLRKKKEKPVIFKPLNRSNSIYLHYIERKILFVVHKKTKCNT